MKTFLKLIFILIIIAVFALGGLCIGIYIKTKENPTRYVMAYLHIGIENKELTEENMEDTINEYSEKMGEDSDEVYYLSYIYLKNALSNALTSSDPYKDMYGKTINELIEEAKEDMKNEGTTIEEFKKGLEELENKKDENGKIILNE